MVLSIAFDISDTPMHQTIVVASETKVLRSTAGRDAVYLLPLEFWLHDRMPVKVVLVKL